MRILFMGTPEFALYSLERLAKTDYDLVGVITKPSKPKGRGYKVTPTPVKSLGERLGLKIWEFEHLNTSEVVSLLKRLSLDLIVVVAFGGLLGKEILDIPKLGVINLHPSLLPKYRGASPIQSVILNGETTTGVTTIWMDEGLDTGDIILQERVEISPEDDAETLTRKLSRIGAEVVIRSIRLIEIGKAPRIKQDERHATYTQRLKREDGCINWRKSAKEIYNLVRGIPKIGAYTYLDNKMLKIWKVKIEERCPKDGVFGEIVEVNERGMVVKTADGFLSIWELQPENKKRMSVQEYLRGHKVKIGTVLGGPT
ncbi:MAG: methionyl-tRNA formyltransferase [bacterium]|nr:methionyl-tRNA formyltransferase [bacterium]